jgi:integration host factor subunit alpha
MFIVEILEPKANVVKSDLVEQVYKRVGFTRQEAEEAVDVLFKEIKTELANGESVRIAGFATFNLKHKKARNARNPQTGQPILIRSRRVLTFKPSKNLLVSTEAPSGNVNNF